MAGIEYARIESTLPQVANKAIGAVEICGIAAMSISDRRGQSRFLLGYSDQMDVVGHEGIGPDVKAIAFGILTKQV